MSAINPIDAPERLSEVARYEILDTPPEEAFDRVTQLVCKLFKVGMSTVTFIDGHRQWFKSRQGVDVAETGRDEALCMIPSSENRALVLVDAQSDRRFQSNSLVCGDPGIRFYAGVPIRTPQGHCVATLCAMDKEPRAFSDDDMQLLIFLAKMVETELELRVQSATDSLTGALSRRAFCLEADRAIALASRHRYDLSCIMLDLDHFKNINDTLGHAAGDRVLQCSVETCRKELRKSDIFGRLGGEEFAVVLPHTDPINALAIAEKLRLAISIQHSTGPANLVTASFGVASFEQSVTDIDALLARADRALYQAKSCGRNRSCFWEGAATQTATYARRVLKAGKITFNLGGSVIDCTVKVLSEVGAKLDVGSSAGIPQRFKLSIPADAFSRACSVLSRTERQLEVVFD